MLKSEVALAEQIWKIISSLIKQADNQLKEAKFFCSASN
jgi:hypothetical protein